jgi:glycosyltransferase involved in cell wall biosynthesis
MEGAAAGKPIITTDNVGCREVVEDGVTGYLCKIKDSVDLADKMEKVILMPGYERNQMGLKGREKMKNEFGIDIVINKYVEILKTIK